MGKQVFISHVHDEAPIAQVLKEWIESSFGPACGVFLSSDPDDVPAGEEWLQRVRNELRNASVVLALCSRRTLTRPWINFELGGAWLKDTPVIVICHSGQAKDRLPVMLQGYQALSLSQDAVDFGLSLLSSLAKRFELPEAPRFDATRMHSDLWSACSAYREQQRRVEVRVDRGSPGWPASLIHSFLPGRDIVDDVARIASLDPDGFGTDWDLRYESGEPLHHIERRSVRLRSDLGIKQRLVLTISPERDGSLQQPNLRMQRTRAGTARKGRK
jgi:TIR domain